MTTRQFTKLWLSLAVAAFVLMIMFMALGIGLGVYACFGVIIGCVAAGVLCTGWLRGR